jgi:hypothetical protein
LIKDVVRTEQRLASKQRQTSCHGSLRSDELPIWDIITNHPSLPPHDALTLQHSTFTLPSCRFTSLPRCSFPRMSFLPDLNGHHPSPSPTRATNHDGVISKSIKNSLSIFITICSFLASILTSLPTTDSVINPIPVNTQVLRPITCSLSWTKAHPTLISLLHRLTRLSCFNL